MIKSFVCGGVVEMKLLQVDQVSPHCVSSQTVAVTSQRSAPGARRYTHTHTHTDTHTHTHTQRRA